MKMEKSQKEEKKNSIIDEQIEECKRLLQKHYKLDPDKWDSWLRTPHPQFSTGNRDKISPFYMIKNGKGDEVIRFLKLWIEE
jgi:hypothetical protein